MASIIVFLALIGIVPLGLGYAQSPNTIHLNDDRITYDDKFVQSNQWSALLDKNNKIISNENHYNELSTRSIRLSNSKSLSNKSAEMGDGPLSNPELNTSEKSNKQLAIKEKRVVFPIEPRQLAQSSWKPIIPAGSAHVVIGSSDSIYVTVGHACTWLALHIRYGCDGKAERWIWRTYMKAKYGATDCNSFCQRHNGKRFGRCIGNKNTDKSSWCSQGQTCTCQ
ncbi:unnamed protein product [Rotaria socialis]